MTSSTWRSTSAWASAALLLLAPAAAAHGPCGCLEPASGPPGTVVRADHPLMRVIFNPARADLGIGPARLWRRHRPGPARVLLRRPYRYPPEYGPGRFTIPRVAPGRYLVALHDGGEGGAHYSWGTITVVGAPPLAFALMW